jgi:hypothetical protein
LRDDRQEWLLLVKKRGQLLRKGIEMKRFLAFHFPQIWIVIFWNSRPVWAAREQVVAKAVDDGLWRGVSTPRPSPRTYLRAGCTRRQCPVDFAADREKTLTKRAMDVSRAVQNLRRWTVT